MGLLAFFRGSEDSATEAEPFEPNLPADLLEQFRQMSPRERRRLVREAEEDAKQSLLVDSTRDYVKERDASLELELSGSNRRILEAAKAELAQTTSHRRDN
jgi:hypothetical protein